MFHAHVLHWIKLSGFIFLLLCFIFLCMLSRKTKLTKLLFGPDGFHSLFMLSSVSSYTQKSPEMVEGTAYQVSSLINAPNWEHNCLVKSLASHMNPHAACRIIELHRSNIDLGVKFFKWICKESTYCYGIDSIIHLLKLIVSSNLFVVAHKAIIGLINDCSTSEDDFLKLTGAIDELRGTGFRLNYPCFSTLLMGLAKLNMGFEAFLVYKRMVADGFVVDVIDYRSIINALCKVGFVQAGEMFLCRVLKVGFDVETHLCTSLVLGYCREKRLREAFKVFDIMSKTDGCGPNSVTYSTLVHGLCEVGEIDRAFALKEEMSENGCFPSTRTYTVLMKAVCDIGFIGKALLLLEEMKAKGCKPNLHTYTVLIDGLCKEGKIEEANGIFKGMLQEGLFPGIVTYNALINGYCKEERIVSAFEILGVMEKKNCKPNMRTYNELMEGLCRVNKPYKAVFLLRRIVDNGLLPNIVTYNILVDGFCKDGQLNVAFKIFKSMKLFGPQPDGFTYTSIIDGLCKNENVEIANGLFCLMVKEGISPDEITFTALMDGYYKMGKTRDALMLCGWMMEHTNLKISHAFNLYLHILCEETGLKEGYAMLGKILKCGFVPSVLTYTILVDGLCQAGDITGSLKVLELMKQDHCIPNVYTYTIVLCGLCQNGRIQEAEKLLFNMSYLGVPPNVVTYTILVKAHATAGRLDHALEVVGTMVKNGCQPNSRTYSALLAGLDRSNKAIKAQSSNSTGHLDDSSLCLEGTIEKCTNIDVELASQLGDKIESCGGSAAEFYNILVACLCREGRMTEADHLTRDKVKYGLFPDKAVCSIIEWYCKEHKYDDCLEFIGLVCDKGLVPSFTSYCLLIQGLYNEGRVEQAEKVAFDLLRYNGVVEKTTVLPYIEFIVKGDPLHLTHELLSIIEQLHCREAPII